MAASSVKASKAALLTTKPDNPTNRNFRKWVLPAIRSRNKPRKNLTVSLTEALLSPAFRCPNWIGTSVTFNCGCDTRISNRIEPIRFQVFHLQRRSPGQEEPGQ